MSSKQAIIDVCPEMLFLCGDVFKKAGVVVIGSLSGFDSYHPVVRLIIESDMLPPQCASERLRQVRAWLRSEMKGFEIEASITHFELVE